MIFSHIFHCIGDHIFFIGNHIVRRHFLTDLDLLIGRPVNGLIAPRGPSPSFCASYLNLCLSFAFSLSMSLSFCKRLVVVKEREEILKGRAMAIKAISAKIHYEIQKHESCEKQVGSQGTRGGEGFSLD